MVRTYFHQPDMTSNFNAHGLALIITGKQALGAKTFLEVPEAWVGFFQALLATLAQQT